MNAAPCGARQRRERGTAYSVTKRDGQVVEFDIQKICKAITKAFDAVENSITPSTIDLLALKVTADFEPKIRDGRVPVEDIQDSVENVLSEAGLRRRGQVLHFVPQAAEKMRSMKSTILTTRSWWTTTCT